MSISSTLIASKATRIAGVIFFSIIGFFVFGAFVLGSHGNIWSGMTEDWIFWGIISCCAAAIGYFIFKHAIVGATIGALTAGAIAVRLEEWYVVASVVLGAGILLYFFFHFRTPKTSLNS